MYATKSEKARKYIFGIMGFEMQSLEIFNLFTREQITVRYGKTIASAKG